MFNGPSKTEFNAWAALNLDLSWLWNSILPYYKKTETYTLPRSEDELPQALSSVLRGLNRR
jgi:hypothetical protein